MGDASSSIILATKYGEHGIRLISSAARSLTYVIYVTSALVVFSLLDLFGVLYRFQLYSEVQHDYIISVIALVLLGVLFPLAWQVVKAKRTLDSWQAVFERGSLQMGISMSMAHPDKGEALRAVTDAVAELEPLRQYLAIAGTSKFIDVSISGINFDGLIDESMVDSSELKSVLGQYGAIVIALRDVATPSSVADFRQQLKSYSDNTGRSVGLAVMVAGEISGEARRDAGEIILVEKANSR
jgi:uncharacterized membrane protein